MAIAIIITDEWLFIIIIITIITVVIVSTDLKTCLSVLKRAV